MKIIFMLLVFTAFASTSYAMTESTYLYDLVVTNSDQSKTFINPKFFFRNVEYPLTSYSRNMHCAAEDLQLGIDSFCDAFQMGHTGLVTWRSPTDQDPIHTWLGVDFITGVKLNNAGQFVNFCPSEFFVDSITCKR
jgi:hypothetical protein